MQIRLLFASPDEASLSLLDSILHSALELTPLDVTSSHAESAQRLIQRADGAESDVVLLDWQLAQEDTPALVRRLFEKNTGLRVVALLPLGSRQYRREVWQAGACSSIAKENMDQEWLSSVLCIMHRAMEREARLRESLGIEQRGPEQTNHVCCG